MHSLLICMQLLSGYLIPFYALSFASQFTCLYPSPWMGPLLPIHWNNVSDKRTQWITQLKCRRKILHGDQRKKTVIVKNVSMNQWYLWCLSKNHISGHSSRHFVLRTATRNWKKHTLCLLIRTFNFFFFLFVFLNRKGNKSFRLKIHVFSLETGTHNKNLTLLSWCITVGDQ